MEAWHFNRSNKRVKQWPLWTHRPHWMIATYFATFISAKHIRVCPVNAQSVNVAALLEKMKEVASVVPAPCLHSTGGVLTGDQETAGVSKGQHRKHRPATCRCMQISRKAQVAGVLLLENTMWGSTKKKSCTNTIESGRKGLNVHRIYGSKSQITSQWMHSHVKSRLLTFPSPCCLHSWNCSFCSLHCRTNSVIAFIAILIKFVRSTWHSAPKPKLTPLGQQYINDQTMGLKFKTHRPAPT